MPNKKRNTKKETPKTSESPGTLTERSSATTEAVTTMNPLSLQLDRSTVGKSLLVNKICRCSPSTVGDVTIGLQKKTGRPFPCVPMETQNFILGLCSAFFKSIPDGFFGFGGLHYAFTHMDAPNDFGLSDPCPCWRCWLEQHMERVKALGASTYTKKVECNSGVAQVRFVVLAFTSLFLHATMELVCDSPDEWALNIYAAVGQWYQDYRSGRLGVITV